MSLTEFRRKFKKESSQHVSNLTNRHGESDDDATLNEIGKFDESYVYEKENDFLRFVLLLASSGSCLIDVLFML